jgi:hypothetical protein
MLTFESPFYEIEDIIIFRDHASPTTFHYLAGPPRLTRTNGKPNLLLLKYKHALDSITSGPGATRDQLGGGFLMFGVDCGIDQTVKDSITSKLQSRVPPGAGNVTLVPVLYTKGKVSVVALNKQKAAAGSAEEENKDDGKFVRGILGTATPSLLQDERAIFSISLDPDATVLIEEAYQSDMSPVGVMYELEFSGLRPALSVIAHVDMKRAYESLKMGLHLGVRTGGDTTTTTTASPTTTTTAAPSTATTTTTRAPSTTTTTTTARPGTQGQPAGSPGTAAGQQGAAAATAPSPTTTSSSSSTGVYVSADLSFALEKLKQEQAIKIEIVRQQEGASVDEMERNALALLKETLLNDFFRPAMSASPAAAATAASSAVANQFMGSTTDTNKGVTGKTQVEVGFQLQYKKEEELKEADFDYSVIAPQTRTHAPNGFFSAILSKTEKAQHFREIDLDDPFFKVLEVEINTIPEFDSLDLKSAVLDLQYGGTIAQPLTSGSITFTPAKKDPAQFQAFVQQGDLSFRHRVTYDFGQSERVAAQTFRTQTPWRTVVSRALVINPTQDVPLLHVYVEAGEVDWDVVTKIEATLIYDDEANRFHSERTYMIAKDTARQEWLVRLANPAISNYQVKYVWHMKDLTELNSNVETHTESHLIVGDPFVDRLNLFIDPRVDPANVARLIVDLHYEDPANKFEVRKQVEISSAPFKLTNVSIPLIDKKKREYTYQVSLVKPSGGAENHAPKSTDQLSIIITEGGVYLDVDLVLIGDLTAAGVEALQIDLQSQPLEGEAPKIESQLFLPSDPAKRVTKRLLLRADAPTEFQYRSLALAGGKQIERGWTKHQSKILLLQLQQLLQP